MSGMQRYLDEYEKYKNVQLETNVVYCKRSRQTEEIMILDIDQDKDSAQIKNMRTENVQHKTLHWCRKNLIKK